MAEILILSAGRRVSLLRAFQQSAKPHALTVVAADMNPAMSSACKAAEKSCELPHIDSVDYAQSLLSYCLENDVKLIVPTIDTELAGLAALEAELAAIGCGVVVSDGHFIDICRDKRKTAAYFNTMGISSPKILDAGDLKFPLLVKPYDGSLSSGVAVVQSAGDITETMRQNPKNIYCSYLDHATHSEYTCDAYFDRDGFIKCVVPRLRVEVRGGEVSKGRTQKNDIVDFLMQKLEHIPGARGCLTVQIMRDNASGRLWLIEVNPRFGGGYPLTARSGAKYHEWLIEEYILGKTINKYSNWTDGLLMLRYDAEIFVE